MPKTVRCEVAGPLATLTLDRPQALNALTLELALDLNRALRQIQQAPAVRVVVLTGAGKAFCAGADLRELRAQDDVPWYLRQLTAALHQAILTLAELPQPVIASVGGVAAGGGLGLALAADLSVAAEGARLTPAFIKLGLPPDSGTTHHLVRLLGEKKAFELLTLSPVLSAQEACALGLVNRVVPDAELDDAVAEWATQLSKSAPLGLARTKQLVRQSLDRPLLAQLEAESLGIVANSRTRDFQEGVAAFLEKRDPNFQGQ